MRVSLSVATLAWQALCSRLLCSMHTSVQVRFCKTWYLIGSIQKFLDGGVRYQYFTGNWGDLACRSLFGIPGGFPLSTSTGKLRISNVGPSLRKCTTEQAMASLQFL